MKPPVNVKIFEQLIQAKDVLKKTNSMYRSLLHFAGLSGKCSVASSLKSQLHQVEKSLSDIKLKMVLDESLWSFITVPDFPLTSPSLFSLLKDSQIFCNYFSSRLSLEPESKDLSIIEFDSWSLAHIFMTFDQIILRIQNGIDELTFDVLNVLFKGFSQQIVIKELVTLEAYLSIRLNEPFNFKSSVAASI